MDAAKTIRWLGHKLLKCYGEICYRLGRSSGYYWALRATCNWCNLDWYGCPTKKVFTSVGWIRI